MNARSIFVSLLLVGLCGVAHGQDTLQGPDWLGRKIDISGVVIGQQPGNQEHGDCVLVQVNAGASAPVGRIWACSPGLGELSTRWIMEGQRVVVQGKASSLQKTKLGLQWRFIPRLDRARIQPR